MDFKKFKESLIVEAVNYKSVMRGKEIYLTDTKSLVPIIFSEIVPMKKILSSSIASPISTKVVSDLLAVGIDCHIPNSEKMPEKDALDKALAKSLRSFLGSEYKTKVLERIEFFQKKTEKKFFKTQNLVNEDLLLIKQELVKSKIPISSCLVFKNGIEKYSPTDGYYEHIARDSASVTGKVLAQVGMKADFTKYLTEGIFTYSK